MQPSKEEADNAKAVVRKWLVERTLEDEEADDVYIRVYEYEVGGHTYEVPLRLVLDGGEELEDYTRDVDRDTIYDGYHVETTACVCTDLCFMPDDVRKVVHKLDVTAVADYYEG